MSSNYLSLKDDIYALASANGMGAIAVIRLSGEESHTKFATVFSKPEKVLESKGYNALYGKICFKDGKIADEVVVVVFKSPKSYTGQDSIDIMCHGGTSCIRDIMLCLRDAGFRQAKPGEFTFRAFSNNKMNLAEAEAVNELISAKTIEAKNDAMTRLQGSLTEEITSIQKELVRLAAACALRLDYGEDEAPEDIIVELPVIEKLITKCTELSSSYNVGKMLKDGASLALVGRTNAGKSSLFNHLLKEERAIVSDIPGTTRDYIAADLELEGIPIHIVDTAGIRQSSDPIEIEGLRRSMLLVDSADIVIYLVDSMQGASQEDYTMIADAKKKCPIIAVWNKVDLPASKPCPQGFIPISVKSGSGFSSLVSAIKAELVSDTAVQSLSSLHIASSRHRDCLLKLGSCLKDAKRQIEQEPDNIAVDMLAVDISTALDAIGQITGETTSEDILDSLFSNFCVGK